MKRGGDQTVNPLLPSPSSPEENAFGVPSEICSPVQGFREEGFGFKVRYRKLQICDVIWLFVCRVLRSFSSALSCSCGVRVSD